jgi:quercetin dioxygenase-like cupin family protein
MYTLNDAKAETVNFTITRLLDDRARARLDRQASPSSRHELVYVLEGVGVLEVDGKPPFALTSGAATIVDPYHTHVSKNASQTHRLKLLTVQLLEKGQPRIESGYVFG